MRKREVEKCNYLYKSGRYLECFIRSFVVLVKEYEHDLDNEFQNIIRENRAVFLYLLIDDKTKREWRIVSRMLLELGYGEKAIDKLFSNIAPVTDRKDRLVRRWRNKCLKRDEYRCVKCSGEEDLCVHHISYWSDDPMNRVNVNNGMTLCKKCHKLEHEHDWFSHLI